ncbi:Rieske (2Fe-2S) protein [Euzebya sp.]|uniref:Rieske (2Fe-2S) protein n=1 Tax=Euzebya sp. TaxID=1971409 RepID=UPI0035135851
MSFERALSLDDLEVGHAACVELAGEPICLVRLDADTVKAVHDTCSHQQYPLHEGWIEGNTIECGLHGSMFDLDTGDPDSLPAVTPIPTYAVRIDDGDVLVDATTPTNGASPPRH